MLTCRPTGFGVVGRLGFGVVDLEFGVVGRLERDPERKRGNRCGDTVVFSATLVVFVHGKTISSRFSP